MFHDELKPAAQQGGALLGAFGLPGGQGGMGAFDGGLGHSGTLIGNGGQQLAVGRVEDIEMRAGAGAPGAFMPWAERLQQGLDGCVEHNRLRSFTGAIDGWR